NGRVTEEVDPNGDVIRWIYGHMGDFRSKHSSLGHFYSDPEGPWRPDQWVHDVPERPTEWEYGRLTSMMNAKSSEDILRGFPDSILGLIRTPPAPLVVIPDADSIAFSRYGKDKGKIYDLRGWVIRNAGAADGTAQPHRWVRDAVSNTTQRHDHDGFIDRFEYNSWNLRSREINSLGHAITYTYTKTKKLASVTDAGGTKTEYVYDQKDRRAQARRNGKLREEYHYDDADNLIAKLDGQRKPLLSFEIGAHNLKTARRLASGENHYFGYDERGYYKSLATDD